MGAQTSGAATSSLGCGLDTTIRTNTKAEAASPVQPINQKKNHRRTVQYSTKCAKTAKLYPGVENLVMSICFQAKLISYYSTGEHNVLYEYI